MKEAWEERFDKIFSKYTSGKFREREIKVFIECELSRLHDEYKRGWDDASKFWREQQGNGVYPPPSSPSTVSPQPFTNPNLHYHGQSPCYQNPCYWCGHT